MLGPSIEVIVRQGEDLVGQHLVPTGVYVLGRDPEAHVPIEGVEGVSRRHAQLTVYPDRAEIEDLGSANGTFVNGKRVTESTRLWPNQKIRLGEATVELRRLKGDAAAGDTLTAHSAALRAVLPEEFLREKKYEIGGVVAQGGMGAILDAREATTGRTVAMKVMLESASPEDLMRFITEAKVTAQLEHPNIVPVYELSVDENEQVFYTMKFVRGITLHTILDLLRQGQPGTIRKYPLANLLTVFQKVCDALAFAHSKGIIHRDLKPANIMIGDFGEVMVMDWGLAKMAGADDAAAEPSEGNEPREVIRVGTRPAGGAAIQTAMMTMAGIVMGTPQFMAPEQARGDVGRLDPRSDIYALGAILYNIIALHPPLEGDDPQALVGLVAAGRTTPLNLAKKYPHLPGGRIPDSLAAVVRKAMAYSQTDRYQSVANLQTDLAAYQNGFATSAERAGLWKQAQLFFRRHKAASIGAAAVLALSAAFTAKVVAEGRRAERALADLRAVAPSMIGQARELIDQQKFDDAVGKISFALQIDPQNADDRLLRAQVLEAQLKLSDAAAEFRRLLALGPNESAAENLALCEKLLSDNKGQPEIAAASLKELHELMVKEQRLTQDAPIAARLGLDRTAVDGRMKALLAAWRKLAGWGKRPETDRFWYRPDGTISLSLRGLPIDDLSPLKGLPITSLEIAETRVSDLAPIAGMRLTYVNTDHDPFISDLQPLRGMPLESATFADCKRLHSLAGLEGAPLTVCFFQSSPIGDLSPLKEAPLQIIDLSNTEVTTLDPLAESTLGDLRAGHALKLADISAVRTMKRLRRAHLENDTAINDVAPLAGCPDLEEIFLPTGPKGVEALRTLGKIRFILYEGAQYSSEEFWIKLGMGSDRDRKSLGLLKKARAALAAGGLPKTDVRAVKVLSDDTLDLIVNHEELTSLEPLRGLPVSGLDIGGSNVTDLSPLAGMPLRRLKIGNLRVADFAPLAQCAQLESLLCSRTGLHDLTPLSKLPLTELLASGNSFTDLSKLAGVPLKVFRFDNTPVTDLKPLLACPTLEWLSIPAGAKDPGVLRQLPHLTRLSDRWDDGLEFPGHHGAPPQLAAEYWKEYDAKARREKK